MDTRPINLGAARVAERQFVKRMLNTRFRLLVGMIFLDFIMLAFVGIGTDSVTAKRRLLNEEMGHIQRHSLGFRGTLADIKAKQRLLDWNIKLSRESANLLEAVTGLTACLPQEIWLSKIETTPKDGQVNVEGISTDMATVARLAVTISEYKSFDDVRLGSSEIQSVDGRPIVRFALSFKLLAKVDGQDIQATSSRGINGS